MPEPETTDTLNNPSANQPDAAGATAPAEDALVAAKAEAAANYDKFMRAAADLENFRRRAVREKDEMRQLATGRVLEDLLPALDNLALGLHPLAQILGQSISNPTSLPLGSVKFHGL